MVDVIQGFLEFLVYLFRYRKIILNLIIYNLKRDYLGTYFGLFWVFFQPIAFIGVIYFVFVKGLRASFFEDERFFFVWLVSGLLPWFFVSSSISSALNSLVSNSVLLKKAHFRVSILPVISIGTELIKHSILVILWILFLFVMDYLDPVFLLQLIYYLFLTIIFLLGLGWLLSSLRVFIKDIVPITQFFLQLLFWVTPIFWNPHFLSKKMELVLFFNPVYYIVEGYRNTFIEHIWFWELPVLQNVIAFVIIFFTFLGGALVFKKLRPYFGDVI